MPRVDVLGHRAFDVTIGDVLLGACEANGVPIEAACGGFAACNTCRIEVASNPEGLTPLAVEEEAFLDAPGQRLACQARVLGDVAFRLAPGA